jgi:hypothetical protein
MRGVVGEESLKTTPRSNGGGAMKYSPIFSNTKLDNDGIKRSGLMVL